MRQKMANIVPRLYQALDVVTSPAKVQRIQEVLAGSPWLWMGQVFVTADQVAFKSPANATPYLYSVPPDLACFGNLLRSFGVRSQFGTSDYCQVLRTMAAETGVLGGGLGAEAGAGGKASPSHQSLDTTRLELALAMVQTLSDDAMRVTDLEIYAPDDSGVLALSTDLVYDDAPWLSKQTMASEIRFVHPKISSTVGDKV